MDDHFYKKAFLVVWLFFSLTTFFIIVSPFILSESTIFSLSPKCEWKAKYNRECILCGMTSAFIDISKGDLKEASKQNRGSIYLFAAFLMNDLSLSVFLFSPKLRKKIAFSGNKTVFSLRK